MSGLTLPQKVWDAHVVRQAPGEPDLLYIDLHLVHEVTSPQAFDGLRLAGRRIRRPDLTIATEDHNVPTADIDQPIADPISARQVEVMRANAAEFDITLYPMGDARQGIVHVIGPEQGRTLPGMTIVCGDSHTATHGAFGALAFGIGTSEVEHVLATQTLPQVQAGLDGHRRRGRAAARRHRQGRDPGHHRPHRDRRRDRPRHRVPRRGHPLALHGGPDDGLQHVDRGRGPGRARRPRTTRRSPTWKAGPHAPSGRRWDEAVEHWRTLQSDPDAAWDKQVTIDAGELRPQVSWGTNPGQVTSIDDAVPDPDEYAEPNERDAAARALTYMGLTAGTPMREIRPDTVFIGSCTNSRIEDLRAAAAVLDGRRVTVPRVMVVPGSHAVKAQAEAEGLDRVFRAAGADWREPGCSMCLAMNPDKLSSGERSASTSNRNFEGRQGKGGRTHLVSPAVAAATAVAGHFATPADLAVVVDEGRADHCRAPRCLCAARMSTPTRSSPPSG